MLLREAVQRCQELNMGFNLFGSLQYQVFFREDRTLEHSALVDKDLDDVVAQATSMRHDRNQQQSGDTIFRSSTYSRM